MYLENNAEKSWNRGFKETVNITIPALPPPRFSSVGFLSQYEERSPVKLQQSGVSTVGYLTKWTNRGWQHTRDVSAA